MCLNSKGQDMFTHVATGGKVAQGPESENEDWTPFVEFCLSMFVPIDESTPCKILK